MSHIDRLLSVATDALAGRIEGITIRRDGDLALLNAGKELMYTGYTPDAELLKGLIVEVSEDRAVRLVAGCLPKFYNLGEDPGNDATFHAVRSLAGSRLVVTEKVDGTNVRPYIGPDGAVRFATRGMLLSERAGFGPDFSALAHAIAAERYPALLDPERVSVFTHILELIHPSNRIVTDYGDRADLVLLALVDNETGLEVPRYLVETYLPGLTVVGAWHVPPGSFDEQVEQLRARWSGTDLEGAVLAIEHPSLPSPFRIKVKAERYLLLTRMSRGCTLKRTAEAVETWGVDRWPAFLERLNVEVPGLPEEVVMGYREHFARYLAWRDGIEARATAVLDWYDALPERDADQKTFALAIADDPNRSALFLIRKLGREFAEEPVVALLRKATPLPVEEEELVAA